MGEIVLESSCEGGATELTEDAARAIDPNANRTVRMVNIEELQRRLGLLEAEQSKGEAPSAASEAQPATKGDVYSASKSSKSFKAMRSRFYKDEVKGMKFSANVTALDMKEHAQTFPKKPCAYLWDEAFTLHSSGAMDVKIPHVEPCRHWEHAATKRRIHTLISTSGLIDHLRTIRAYEAPEKWLLTVHDAAYIDRVKDASAASGGWVGEEAYVGPGGYRIAQLSAGGCLAALDTIFGTPGCPRAYVLCRPLGIMLSNRPAWDSAYLIT